MVDNPGMTPPKRARTTLPFADLTPDRMFDAIEGIGMRCDGRLTALGSYENRVVLIGLADGAERVAKFYRPGRWSDAQILEEHAFVAELRADEVPVVAPLVIDGRTLHTAAGQRFALYPRQGGRAPEFDRPDVLEWMGRLLARVHAVGARSPFVARPRLDIESFGYAARDSLMVGGMVPDGIADVWAGVVDQALDGVATCFERAGRLRYLRTHGDCHVGNVLWSPGDGPHFVDFDDARMAPAVQDLWMLLGAGKEMREAWRHVRAGYALMRDFDDAELEVVEALRTLRLLHHAAWIAARWDDPAFPAAFPWFAQPRYWEARVLELREQIARMDEPLFD